MTSATGVTSGAERMIEALAGIEVELVFGLPGVHNLAIWKVLAASGIRLIGVRHEQAAVYAADGYARATGRLGVAIVTTGPGAANTLGATGEAMASGSPVLVIATDIATGLRRDGIYRGVLHETRDQAAMFAPVTKLARTLTAADGVGSAVEELAAAAREAPSGPAYLGVPTDLLARAEALGSEPPPTPAAEAVPPALLERAAEILASAERPLIWAGGGALRSGAGPELGRLAERLAAPLLTTYTGRGLLGPDHPCAVPGPVHAEQVGALWDEADTVLAVGTDFDGMMTQNWAMPAPSTLISVNVDELDASKNYESDLTLRGDARAVLTELLPLVSARPGLEDLSERLAVLGEEVQAAVRADEPAAAEFLETFERTLPADSVIVADMCIPGYWLAGYRRVPAPRKLAYPVGWGTLGFAFPAAIGAALAGTGPTVCVSGDGGFLFACGELATVAEAAVPLTVVLIDDGGYGMLRFDQIDAGEEAFGVDLTRPDFVALGTSFGVSAHRFDGFGRSFERALGESIASREPRLLVVDAALRPPPTTSPRWYRRAR